VVGSEGILSAVTRCCQKNAFHHGHLVGENFQPLVQASLNSVDDYLCFLQRLKLDLCFESTQFCLNICNLLSH
jgi:hypothetical protein